MPFFCATNFRGYTRYNRAPLCRMSVAVHCHLSTPTLHQFLDDKSNCVSILSLTFSNMQIFLNSPLTAQFQSTQTSHCRRRTSTQYHHRTTPIPSLTPVLVPPNSPNLPQTSTRTNSSTTINALLPKTALSSQHCRAPSPRNPPAVASPEPEQP